MASEGILKLQTNIPEIIALEYGDGRIVQSQYSGDQLMFSLTDGRKMYLPPFMGDKLKQAGIAAGTPFELCRREVSRGNRRTVEYQVRNLDGAGASNEDVPALAPGAQLKAPKPLNGINGNGPVPAPVSAPVVPAPSELRNGAGETHADLLARAYRQAVDIALGAQEYAKEKGLLITPTFEDVRALAATLHISATQRGVR